MMPPDVAIDRVMRETGMDRMQAICHLRGRQAAIDALSRQRRGEPYQPAPRSFTTGLFRSFLPPGSFDHPQELTRLRCYGSGVDSLAEGQPGHYASAEAAERAGARWVETGISPAYQRD